MISIGPDGEKSVQPANVSRTEAKRLRRLARARGQARPCIDDCGRQTTSTTARCDVCAGRRRSP